MKVVLLLALAHICLASAVELSKPVALSIISGDLRSIRDDCNSGSIRRYIPLKYDNEIKFEVTLSQKGVLLIDGDVTVALLKEGSEWQEEQKSGALYYDCNRAYFFNRTDTFSVMASRYVTKYDRSKVVGSEDEEKKIEYMPADMFSSEILSAASTIARSARQTFTKSTHTLRNGKTLKMWYNRDTDVATVDETVYTVTLKDGKLVHSSSLNSVSYRLGSRSSFQISDFLGIYAVRVA